LTTRIPKFQRTPKPWRTTGSRKLIDLGEVKLYRDKIVSKSGFKTDHLRLSLHDFSIVVPVLDGDRLAFIWNYRHPIQGWELELPAGLVDDGEDPESGAKRELKEDRLLREVLEESWLVAYFARNIVSAGPRFLGAPVEEGHREPRALRVHEDQNSEG
jgi:hypothetical protein